MPYYTDIPQTVERNGRTYKIELEPDWFADYDWIGEYVNKLEPYVIDRRKGLIMGDWEDEPFYPDPQDYDSEEAYDAAHAEWAVAYDDWNDRNQMTILGNVDPHFQYGEMRYFKPYAYGIDPDEDLETWIAYAEHDYERVRGLERNEWCFVTMIASIVAPQCPCCGHTETLHRSCGGIESDSGDEHMDEIRDDLISELEEEYENVEHDLARCRMGT